MEKEPYIPNFYFSQGYAFQILTFCENMRLKNEIYFIISAINSQKVKIPTQY